MNLGVSTYRPHRDHSHAFTFTLRNTSNAKREHNDFPNFKRNSRLQIALKIFNRYFCGHFYNTQGISFLSLFFVIELGKYLKEAEVAMDIKGKKTVKHSDTILIYRT